MGFSGSGLSRKIGGLAVKGMIRDIEQRMARGEQITTPQPTTEEAKHLQEVQIQNQQSAQHAAQG